MIKHLGIQANPTFYCTVLVGFVLLSYFLLKGNTHGEDTWPGYEQIPLVEALNGTIKPDNIPEGIKTKLPTTHLL